MIPSQEMFCWDRKGNVFGGITAHVASGTRQGNAAGRLFGAPYLNRSFLRLSEKSDWEAKEIRQACWKNRDAHRKKSDTPV